METLTQKPIPITLNQLSKEPPKEFKLWPFGTISSTKGDFLLDKAAARQVVDSYNKHGADIGFDYEHRSLDPQGEEDHRSAGWAKMELRPDGVYLTQISWTPKAFAALKNKEYRYFSPAFDTDPPFNQPLKKGQLRRITRLVNVALTNNPATHGLTALVAASQRGNRKMGEDEVEVAPPESPAQEAQEQPAEMELHQLLNQVIQAIKQGDIQALQGMVASLESQVGADVQRDQAEGELPPGFGAELASDDALAPDDDEPKAALCNKPKMGMLSQIEKFLGVKGESQVFGKIVQLSERAEEAAKLSKKVQVSAKDAHANLVENAIRKGQLLPAKKAWALSQSTEVLKGYLHGIPEKSVQLQPQQRPVALAEAPSGIESVVVDGKPYTLSQLEINHLARSKSGLSKEAYIRSRERIGGV